MGGAGCVGGAGKVVDGVFPGRHQSLRPQRRPVNDCSHPGRGGMAQDGGTRGETLRGEMDCCRESQGWTTTCSTIYPNVTGRTKERITQSKRARAGLLAIVDWPHVARTCILRKFGLQMSCCLSLVSRLFCFVLFSFVCFFFEAAVLRSIILRSSICMRPDSNTQVTTVCILLEMALFPSIFVPLPFFSLSGEYIVRFFLPGSVFLPSDHGLDFFTSAYVRTQLNSINQSINVSLLMSRD